MTAGTEFVGHRLSGQPATRRSIVWRTFSGALAGFAGLLLAASLGGCASSPTQAEIDAAKKVRFEDTGEGARAVLDESILFEFGKAEFAHSAEPVLDVLQPAFAKARGQIIIEGHTDSVGNDAFNRTLSKRRADKVREALIQRRVAPERILARGMSSSKPRRSPEVTDDDRRVNRRAEFLFPGETVSSLGGAELERRSESRLAEVSRTLKETADKVGDWLKSKTGGDKK